MLYKGGTLRLKKLNLQISRNIEALAHASLLVGTHERHDFITLY